MPHEWVGMGLDGMDVHQLWRKHLPAAHLTPLLAGEPLSVRCTTLRAGTAVTRHDRGRHAPKATEVPKTLSGCKERKGMEYVV